MSNQSTVEVLPEDERPARRDGRCFYCRQPIGEVHELTCVLVRKLILAKMTMAIPMQVPWDETEEQFNFYWNEGTHCNDNLATDLAWAAEFLNAQGACLCPIQTRVVASESSEDGSYQSTSFGVVRMDGMEDNRVEWVKVLDETPPREVEFPETEPSEIVTMALAEISNRRCREGVEYVCAARFAGERARWCEPCLARDAFERARV